MEIYALAVVTCATVRFITLEVNGMNERSEKMSGAGEAGANLTELLSEANGGVLELAATGAKALAIEAASNSVSGECGLDLLSMNKPGTVIWTDPKTGEERYTPPGDRMYSTAMMYAVFVIDKDGNRIEW